MGEDAFLHPGHEDDRELEPLRQVEGHQGHAARIPGQLVQVAHERGGVEEPLHRRVLVRELVVLGGGDQLLQVLEPPLGLGALLLPERLPVAGGVQHLVEEGGYGQGGPSLPEAGAEPGELLEPAARLAREVRREEGTLLQQRVPLAGGHLLEPDHARAPDAPRRRPDRAPEGDVVARVQREAQVRERVLDLPPLVEADGADEDVGHAAAAQRLLEHARLSVRAVEDGDVAPLPPLVPEAPDRLGDEVRLLVLVPRAIDRGRLPLDILGPERLLLARDVVGDHRRRRGEDALGRAVVLLEADDLGAGIVLLEIEDVAHVGSPPPIDRLVRIAHDADVPMLLRERADDPILGAVRVLVLVDQDPLPEPAVPGQHLRHPVEEPDGEQEEVVEVHRPRGGEPLLVAAVHGRDLLLAGATGQLLRLLHGQHLVLGVAQPVHEARRRRRPLVHVELAHAVPDHRQPVVLVVDHEVRRVPDVADMLAQDADARRVEGGDERRPHPRRPEQRFDPAAHLLGRLVGEGDGEDLPGVHAPGAQEVGDPVGDDPGLAAAGTR